MDAHGEAGSRRKGSQNVDVERTLPDTNWWRTQAEAAADINRQIVARFGSDPAVMDDSYAFRVCPVGMSRTDAFAPASLLIRARKVLEAATSCSLSLGERLLA